MDDLKFYGKDGKEAEDFVTAVIALDQGKNQDSVWTAAFASTCFYGAALRWFEDLDDTVQSDWKLLRKAILQQWPAETRSGGRRVVIFRTNGFDRILTFFDTRSSLPTSAAAPPPPTGRTAPGPSAPIKSLSSFKCIYCKVQFRPVDEEFCSARCRDSASGVAPLLIELDATDPLHKEVNALFGLGWQNPRKKGPAVKRIFKIVMKPTLMEYYYAYQRAVEQQGNFVSKRLKPGNERKIWAGVRRSCIIGDDWTGARPCSKSNCEVCKIIKNSFDVPNTGLEWLPFGAAIRGTTVSSKADDYAINGSSSQTNQKALILASVMMGEIYVSHARLTSLPPGFQSISCEPGPNSDFNYNDTVVYNEDAIRPEFLVVYDTP